MYTSNLKFTTLNTKSIRSQNKCDILSTFIEKNPSDILFLQETNCTHLSLNHTQYTIIINPSTQPYNGTIIIANNYSCNIISNEILYNGFLQKVKINIIKENLEITLYNTYLPHNEATANDILTCLSNDLKKNKNLNIILGGDFNCTLLPLLDRINSTEIYKNTCLGLKQICNTNKLYDIWSEILNLDQGFTFIKKTTPLLHHE